MVSKPTTAQYPGDGGLFLPSRTPLTVTPLSAEAWLRGGVAPHPTPPCVVWDPEAAACRPRLATPAPPQRVLNRQLGTFWMLHSATPMVVTPSTHPGHHPRSLLLGLRLTGRHAIASACTGPTPHGCSTQPRCAEAFPMLRPRPGGHVTSPQPQAAVNPACVTPRGAASSVTDE